MRTRSRALVGKGHRVSEDGTPITSSAPQKGARGSGPHFAQVLDLW
ncbi:MAG TPA: hypothetical protein VHM65_06965 [Candidatus Lustribacter sp.]|nr:hypothetical protein [Candidatus Lustribacter sp.]